MGQNRNTLIWLNSLGIHSDVINQLIDYLGDITEIHNIEPMELNSLGLLTKSTLNRINKSDYKISIESFFNELDKLNIDVMTVLDDDFPKELLQIPDKPVVLYKKGEIYPNDHLSIGIVGSRKATHYGKWAAEKFTRELVQMGVTIVSGMAVGIDTIAHRSALEHGGRTIGILGNGLDTVYPKSNKNLYDDVINNGSLISEFPPGTQPYNFHFPMRNRIISGLSLGVIVVEAQQKSGSLITAHHALAQGKEVFALPGNINSIYSQGTNLLIKDGAKLLLDMDDILEEVRELMVLRKSKIVAKQDNMDLSETEIKVLEYLKEGPIHSDLIVLNSRLDIQTVISTLTILELKGIIKEMSSRIFTII